MKRQQKEIKKVQCKIRNMSQEEEEAGDTLTDKSVNTDLPLRSK